MRAPPKPQGNTSHAQFLRDTCTAIDANRLLPGPGYRIRESPEGIVLEIERQAPFQLFHPFKIYQIAPFTFRIRGGYVACRPRRIDYRTAVSNGATYLNGNSEVRLELDRGGSDGGEFVYNTALAGLDGTKDYSRGPVISTPATAQIGITDETVTIGNSGDYTVSNSANTALWKLSQQNDTTSGPAAAFWIEYSDTGGDGSIPILKIKARMITGDNPSLNSRSDEWFPSTASTPFNQVIPIGYVWQADGNIGIAPPDNPADLDVVQLLDHHVINHTPFGAFGFNHAPLYYRGIWSDGTHSGLVYYPGDCVSKDDGSGGSNGLYIWQGGYPAYPAKETSGPGAGGAWVKMS